MVIMVWITFKSILRNLCAIYSSTSNRDAALQNWPWFSQDAFTSSNRGLLNIIITDNDEGGFTSSLKTIFCRVELAAAIAFTPLQIDLMKSNRLTSLWILKKWPDSVPLPLTTLTLPGGKPAWRTRSAKYRADSGVSSNGFSTTVFPVGKAWPISATNAVSGLLHGRKSAHTQKGCRLVYASFDFVVGITLPSIFRKSWQSIVT